LTDDRVAGGDGGDRLFNGAADPPEAPRYLFDPVTDMTLEELVLVVCELHLVVRDRDRLHPRIRRHFRERLPTDP
jgi:hypothetical protein